MAVFISHSSRDNETAAAVEMALEERGIDAWIDLSEIRVGAPLDGELQGSIGNSSAVVLLWSEAAAASRWVNTEWLMAVHEGIFVVPCSLDAAPLPQCLENSVYLHLGARPPGWADALARAVRNAPGNANKLAPVIRAQERALTETIATVNQAQAAMLEQLQKRDIDAARSLQALADEAMQRAEALWRRDPEIANLGGYQKKNAYLLKHWDDVQAGRAPKDPLLVEAEWRFFDSLSVDPTDPSALNGIGNVFFFGRYLDAAEAFHTWAIARAADRGFRYDAAEHDLALVRHFKKRAN